jgi:hypothetical protein
MSQTRPNSSSFIFTYCIVVKLLELSRIDPFVSVPGEKSACFRDVIACNEHGHELVHGHIVSVPPWSQNSFLVPHTEWTMPDMDVQNDVLEDGGNNNSCTHAGNVDQLVSLVQVAVVPTVITQPRLHFPRIDDWIGEQVAEGPDATTAQNVSMGVHVSIKIPCFVIAVVYYMLMDAVFITTYSAWNVDVRMLPTFQVARVFLTANMARGRTLTLWTFSVLCECTTPMTPFTWWHSFN